MAEEAHSFHVERRPRNLPSYFRGLIDLDAPDGNVTLVRSVSIGPRDLMEQLAPRDESLKRHETVFVGSDCGIDP
jgi:hypothetical protein